MASSDVEVHHTNGAGNGAHKAIPLFGALKPHLVFKSAIASDALLFYKRAFGAQEVGKTQFQLKRKADQEVAGGILYARLKVGPQAEFVISDDAEHDLNSATTGQGLKGGMAMFTLETGDLESALAQAKEAGAEILEEATEQPWGQTCAKVADPFGFVWNLATPYAPEEVVHAAETAPQAGDQ